MGNRRIRPFLNAALAVARQALNTGAWLPLVGLAMAKALFLIVLARLDLVPWILLSAVLALVPQAASRLHYPDLPFLLPAIARLLDLVCFVSLGGLAEA